jgi:RimJ/RimL family protein N-acetyltransferase
MDKIIMDKSNSFEELMLGDTILYNIIEELKHLKLSPKDYINIANSLLDLAINKPEEKPITSANYITDRKITFPLKYEDIAIRRLNYSKDLKVIKEWTTDNFGKEFLLSRIDNKETHVEDLLNDKQNIFGIIETQSKVLIGILGFLHYDIENGKDELRKLIGNSDYRGKGLGKKATKLWISYGLNLLKLRKIYIYTFETNLRNIRINSELGFILEGIFKAENIYNGEAKDIIRMALVAQ